MKKRIKIAVVAPLLVSVILLLLIGLVQTYIRTVSAVPPVQSDEQEISNQIYLADDGNSDVEISSVAYYDNTIVRAISDVRRYLEPEITVTDTNGLSIRLYSPAKGEMLITDPMGRCLGVDLLTGQTFNEIPYSGFGDLGEDDSSNPTKELNLVRIPDGEYTLRITGTGNGTYSVEMNSWMSHGKESQISFDEVSIAPGEVHIYTIEYSKDNEISVLRVN